MVCSCTHRCALSGCVSLKLRVSDPPGRQTPRAASCGHSVRPCCCPETAARTTTTRRMRVGTPAAGKVAGRRREVTGRCVRLCAGWSNSDTVCLLCLSVCETNGHAILPPTTWLQQQDRPTQVPGSLPGRGSVMIVAVFAPPTYLSIGSLETVPISVYLSIQQRCLTRFGATYLSIRPGDPLIIGPSRPQSCQDTHS